MKFIVNRTLFLDKLQIVQKAMASRTVMPALSGVLITCEKGLLTMLASNNEIAIKITLDDPSLKLEDDGKCLVPGKLFGDIIKKLNGADVDIELEQDNILRIQSGTSDITLNLLDVEDYPEQKFDLTTSAIKVNAFLLKELIKQTTFASSIIDSKPILTGVNIRIDENIISGVATDSYRLSKRVTNLDEACPSTNIIIPARNFNELSKIIADDCAFVEMYPSTSKILFKFDDILFQTKLLEGRYPDTAKLIPTTFPIIVKYNKEDLMSAIDRVSTLSSNPSSTTVVKMIIEENGTATLMSNSPELGTIKDVINPVETETNTKLTISFSANYFLDALKAFSSENVYVKFNGEIKPFIFEAENDEGLIELVLPMKSE